MRRFTILLIVGAMATAVFALFTLFTPTVQADNVGGTIDTNTTWTLAGSPYLITSNIIIQPGVTLTIEAGVEVQAQPSLGMTVNGTLLALGTAVEPITFTSTTETGPGDWNGITVNGSGSASFMHSLIRYAGRLQIWGATQNPVMVVNTTFYQNQSGPTTWADSVHRLQMSNVIFDGNSVNRVRINSVSAHSGLADNAILTAEDGLEGYEIIASGSYPFLDVPEGVTLTVEPGVTVLSSPNGHISVDSGHLDAQGTITQPITFTSVANSGPGEWAGLGLFGYPVPGTAVLKHVTIQYTSYGIYMYPSPNGLVVIEDSLFKDNLSYPLEITPDFLPKLVMTDTTFMNNGVNRILINAHGAQGSIAANTRLTPQPGLEGYEFRGNDFHDLIVPQGITLTLEAGSTLMMPQYGRLYVDGHLQANGLEGDLVTFTSAANSGAGEWGGVSVRDTGTANLDRAMMRYSQTGLYVFGNTDNPVILNDAFILANHYAIGAAAHSMHRVQMNHVTFTNNVYNRFFISLYGSYNPLADDVTLTVQPGLEGYELEGSTSLVIPSGIEMSLDPGVQVMGRAHTQIVVEGTLQSNGTAVQPITFTSTTETGPGDWGGIRVNGSGTVSLTHTTIRHAWASLYISGATTNTVQLTNSEISNNQVALGSEVNAIHRLIMHNVTFSDNVSNRIFIESAPSSDDSLIANSILTAQPGLEGYQFVSDRPSNPNPFIIPAGITLSVEADLSLVFNNRVRLEILGRLEAQGTAVAPITFTSALDNAPGQWRGIVVDGGVVSLAHATVRYATTNLTVNSPTSTVAITSSRLISASVNGITVNNGLLNAACSVIAGNGGNGVFVAASGTQITTITTSEIWGNVSAGITNTQSLLVDGRLNFWGDPSGPGGNGPGSGDAVYGNVLYEPWLTEPTCSPLIELPPIITISDSTAVESALFVTFTVTLNITSEQDVLLDYGTVDGAAVAGVDYQPISGTLTIPAGQATAVLTATLFDNDLDDGDRYFELVLSNPVSAELGIDTAVGTILDDDDPPIEPPITPTVSISDSTAVESAPFLTFTVTLYITSEQDVSVDYETVDGTAVAGVDYLPISGTLVIPAGQLTAVLTVTLLNNTLDDGDRMFTLVLRNPVNADLGDGTAVGTILDEDLPPITPTITITDSTASETSLSLPFTVTLNITSEQDVLVDYETVDSTAVAHTDYLPISGTLVIPAGQLTAVLTVTLLDNSLDDGDRMFTLVLSYPVNADLGDGTAVGLILDDDDPPIEPPITPTISISDSTAVENAPSLTFTVNLNITSEQDVLVDYETMDDTAVAGVDYLPISGTLVIPAGQLAAVLTVTLLNNTLEDGDRSFTLVLSDPVNADLGDDTAVGTILDDDLPPPIPGWHVYLPVIGKP